MSENQILSDILKSHKKFFTTQRKVIVEELLDMDNHPTAEEIFMTVKKRLAKISLGTIYRNLQVLEELGVIDKITLKIQGESRYEMHKNPHYHVVCTECFALKDLGSFRSISLEPTAANISGFAIHNHEVTAYGICPSCQYS